MDPAQQPPRPSDLLIRESADLTILESREGGDGVFNPDGTVDMVLIRPCAGRGVFNNIYEADVLKRDAEAGVFKGWPMFDNHDNPAARKARLGLPRSVSDLAGVIRETYYDPDLTTPDDDKYGYEKGAAIGRCKLTGAMEALVREVPEAIKGSLNCQATNKRMGQKNGAKGWIVEGFVNDPENSSFDLVTKAGAGGRVRSVLESLYDGSNATNGLASALADVSDDDLAAFLAEHRPDVLEGGPVNLQEALQSDEVKGYIKGMITEGVQEAVAENANGVDADTLRQQIREEFASGTRVRRLAGDARGIIEAAKGLTKGARANLLDDYGFTEGDDDTLTPHRSLSVIEAVTDTEGKVTKTDREVLKDAVEADITRYRTAISEAAPTIPVARVTGGTGGEDGEDNDVVESAWEQKIRQRGLDPTQFGAPKREPAKA
jgi:hypothetical protein